MKNDLVLKVNDLSKTYHSIDGETIALDNVNFSVYDKDFISIVGPSGCGKSTILSILSELEDISSGNVYLKDGYTIGYMLQDDCLFSWRTILDNCLIGLEVKNLLNTDNKNYVISLLKKYGLEEFMYKYPDSLSGGMRQRVALIRTLATKPDILLLDEAMSALDYQSRLAIGDDIYKIIKEEGKTAIMVTHDIAEAVSMSDKVIVLTKRPGTVKNIYDINYKHKTTPMNNRKEEEFNKYFEMIWRDLDVHI